MAKSKQTVKTTKKKGRRKKTGSGYVPCGMCHGTGKIKLKNGGAAKR